MDLKKKVVIDCDPGVDDSFALLLCIRFLDVKGIVAVFFGFTDALATSLKSGSGFPSEFIEMIPYASTMLAVVVIGIIRTNKARKVAKGGH